MPTPTSDQPFRRLGLNSWQELLDAVNEVLETPPDNCPPQDPVETPPECTILTVTLINDLQDVMRATAQDPDLCFDFDEVNDCDKWTVAMIQNMYDNIENMFCDCEQCLLDCLDAGKAEEIIFVDDNDVAGGTCVIDDDSNNASLFALMTTALSDYNTARTTWEGLFVDECELNALIDSLQSQKAALEEQIAAAGASDTSALEAQLADLQVTLDEKLDELSDLEDEISDAGTELTTKRDLYVYYGDQRARQSTGEQSVMDLIYNSGITVELKNTTCYVDETDQGIGHPCHGETPRRCLVTFTVESRDYLDRFDCDAIQFPSDPGYTGWTPIASGGFFDPYDGRIVPPFMTQKVNDFFCTDAEWGVDCAIPTIDPGIPDPPYPYCSRCIAAPSSSRTQEWRIRVSYPEPVDEECNCAGFVCGTTTPCGGGPEV